jgi:hypothetical protein
MAFQKDFTDMYGENYPESYWRCAQCNICKENKEGLITFLGYPDAAHKGGRVVGQKEYVVGEAMYDSYLAPSELNPEGVNPFLMAYTIAEQTLDGPAPEEGAEDTRVSFFAGALTV